MTSTTEPVSQASASLLHLSHHQWMPFKNFIISPQASRANVRLNLLVDADQRYFHVSPVVGFLSAPCKNRHRTHDNPCFCPQGQKHVQYITCLASIQSHQCSVWADRHAGQAALQ
jgi:hypothetical protein